MKLHVCLFAVPTALRVNGPTNGLGVDGRPPLLSPSQVSIGPQSRGYRSSDLGDSTCEYSFVFLRKFQYLY